MPKFRDGLYKVSCSTRDGETVEHGEILASVRDGQILGSDSHGGLYIGLDRDGAAAGSSVVSVACQVPPGGELITGHEGGAAGYVIEVEAELDPYLLDSSTTIDIGGTEVDIQVRFLGPLPSIPRGGRSGG